MSPRFPKLHTAGLKLNPEQREIVRLAKKAQAEETHIQFAERCVELGIPIPTSEYPVTPGRKWRFDYAWPDRKVALEVEGGVWTGRPAHPRLGLHGRHGEVQLGRRPRLEDRSHRARRAADQQDHEPVAGRSPRLTFTDHRGAMSQTNAGSERERIAAIVFDAMYPPEPGEDWPFDPTDEEPDTFAALHAADRILAAHAADRILAALAPAEQDAPHDVENSDELDAFVEAGMRIVQPMIDATLRAERPNKVEREKLDDEEVRGWSRERLQAAIIALRAAPPVSEVKRGRCQNCGCEVEGLADHIVGRFTCAAAVPREPEERKGEHAWYCYAGISTAKCICAEPRDAQPEREP